MPEFSADWTSAHEPLWLKLFTHLGWIGKPGLSFLEIGCFEGRSTIWFLENVLTDRTSRIDCVDTFEGSPEHAVMTPDALLLDLFDTFTDNVAPYGDKVVGYACDSVNFLRSLSPYPYYDFVYVDGSHRASDVLTDAVLAWPLLKPGGVLLFDDNGWAYTVPDTGERLEPGRGIQAFLTAFEGQYEPLANGTQIGILKR